MPQPIMKTVLTQLTIAGGAPAFTVALHVGRPNIGDRRRLSRRIDELLDRRWLTNNGPYVQEFECRISERVGVRDCVAVCNGTAALEIAIRALGLEGEVIVPSFTFAGTVHALQWQGITPVFCDVARRDHTIDVDRVEALITSRTSAILGVHLWGNACRVDELAEIATRRNVRLLFDAAHALGSSYKGRMIGNHGDAETFSFHATKFVNAFEGGAIVTNDSGLAQRMRLMRNFGFRGFDDVACVGTNAKMSEISAAMGLTSLESMEEFLAVNARHYENYRRELADIPGMTLLAIDENEQRNYQYIVVEVDESCAGISRDDLVQILHTENVLARRYFFPGCHRMAPYRERSHQALGETERLAECVMCLPTGSSVTDEDVIAICQIIRLAVAHAEEVRMMVLKECESPDLAEQTTM